ncbi:BF3164 family lipoprotein [Balneola vulgaris]|uniref:BF3164 family lipoprotein n=1 Tax=Balneola vulgaris TaxID=287535 RepID=UPI000373AC6F|nr:BF3164 family lipoprotein [Balneola vulgaris]
MNNFLWALILLFPTNLLGQSDSPISGRTIFEDELIYPSDLVVVGDYLFVKDLLESTGEYGVKTFSLKDEKKVNEFITIGRGPSEYLNINIRNGPLDRTIEITDSRNRKNDIYSVDCLVTVETGKSISKCLKASRRNMTSREAIVLNDSLVINTASSAKGVIFLSLEGKILNHIDEIPTEILKKYKNPSVAAMVMGGYLVANKTRTRIAYFAKYYDQVYFLENSDAGMAIIKEYHFTHLPEFIVLNEGGSSYMEPSDKAKFGYKSPYPTENYVYVLYSGKTLDDVEESEDIEWRAYANRIKIFDWNGVEKGEILVNEVLSSIAVSTDSREIYGVTTDRALNSSIIKYTVN